MPRNYSSQIKKFGAVVFAHRRKAVLTQLALAEAAGVDVRTIRRIENGEFAVGLEIVFSLARVFKIQPGELLEKVKLKFD
jgi:DNA-binding XRE family transcriptional regulator